MVKVFDVWPPMHNIVEMCLQVARCQQLVCQARDVNPNNGEGVPVTKSYHWAIFQNSPRPYEFKVQRVQLFRNIPRYMVHFYGGGGLGIARSKSRCITFFHRCKECTTCDSAFHHVKSMWYTYRLNSLRSAFLAPYTQPNDQLLRQGVAQMNSYDIILHTIIWHILVYIFHTVPIIISWNLVFIMNPERLFLVFLPDGATYPYWGWLDRVTICKAASVCSVTKNLKQEHPLHHIQDLSVNPWQSGLADSYHLGL